MSPGNNLTIENLTKSFGRQKVLKGISFTVPEGETVVVIGGSGQGKSVLLKHVMRLLVADEGDVLVGGQPIMKLTSREMDEVRKGMGMVFQEAALFDSMSLLENVAFPLRMHSGLRDREIIKIAEENLERVGLRGVGGKMPSEVSGGMKKRVGIARAISMRPGILLYDEPTTGLDPVLSSAIDELILKMRSELGVTSLVISHDMKSAFRIADKIIFLYQGVIQASGTPAEIQASKDPVVRQFISGDTVGPISVI
ncbi:ABC transporter ATP-binding protein [Leptospirillum ferrooxidans]|jgi:phospholipid/cholesterol/gamma-HCH transport system ATP-binding protein|uniref:Putative ABC transporter, ATP-binding protein n=1 Tax=Leptospirillum ferrooxidans (strain C2-3) TaxID=1162668 RepID=I0IRC0_LEPFC|nr:ABC transporter ATP-binding protein [Leptospirillum ferrooxidans]BAM07819.1 putative ABC transporter, ATP-binding protein [Leptospirillum ferrooxidans C2-3]